MAKRKSSVWVTLLTSGVAVAALTFGLNKSWDVFHHRAIGPKYVQTSLRFEDGKILLFVRNNSDDPLDLVDAKIDVDDPDLAKTAALGIYPDISKVYEVKSSAGKGTIAAADNGLSLDVRIAQAIAPKAADQFAIGVVGLAGSVDLSNSRIRAQLRDIKGRTYTVAQ